MTRATERLDARLETLETGRVLVTTPEQTLLDLAKRPNLGEAPDEARAAVVNLLPRVDRAKVERLARAQRVPTVWHAIEKV